MAPTRSAEFSDDTRRTLLQVARESVACGVRSGSPIPIRPEELPAHLVRHRACFITLRRFEQLRGCIGSLEATRPLIVEVAETACSAALDDPRFHPVREAELNTLNIEVSILSPLSEIHIHTEQMLLDDLRPGVDGLVLDFGDRRATFLPKLWEQLPEPATFVEALKQKAGLPVDFWSPDIQAYRYLTETFSEPHEAQAPT
jgi:AmmeMemoRadiSam system protein A